MLDQILMLKPGETREFEFDLAKGETLVGKVTADKPVDAMLLDADNLAAFQDGEEPEYDDGGEQVRRTAIDFRADRRGTYTLVLKNRGIGRAEVEVDLRLRR